jgi:protein TonB
MPLSTNTARLFEHSSQNRMLVICVVVSIVLHSLVLFLSPGMRPGAPAAALKVLTATLGPRTAAPEPRPPEPQLKPQVKPPPEPPKPVLTRPTPEPSAPRVQQEATPPAPVAPPQAAQAAPSAPAAPAAPAAQTASAAPAAPVQASARGGDSTDSGNLDQYRLALIGVAKKYKRYPAQAMEKGWTGKVEVRLVIGANGLIQSALVKSSSGYEILDNVAVDMIKKAKPLTPIPAALRGKEFTVDIPVIFDLQTG